VSSRLHFLLTPGPGDDIFTPEQLDDSQLVLSDTVKRFFDREIRPNIKALLEHEPGLVRHLLEHAAGLGLMSLSIPERYGGMELDLISTLVVAEQTSRDASYMVWEGGHTTIGTLPILYFGTPEQKQRYLPRLATLELLAAYALSEPQAGSDALAARTRADLSADGTHYRLNGQKMWVSNAAEADLFTVFAQVDGDKFTAFLVERTFPGVRLGAEESKMGLHGTSTTALYLDDVPVPVSNVLGEVGRGHVIAFNILNLGRLKMGVSTVGTAREVLRMSLAYARGRHAFGSPISEFGAIRHKFAEMIVWIFAVESAAWRTAGLIQNADGGISWGDPDAGSKKLAAVREFAPECSIVKVAGSEMLDFVADEGVQIHGGYGYHADYPVERAYRDSRINRIFEGTNEINRLVIARRLLKDAGEGSPIRARAASALASPMDLDLTDPVGCAKQIALIGLGLALAAWPEGLESRQEPQMRIADMLIDVYLLESASSRSRQMRESRRAELARTIVTVLSDEARTRIAENARELVGSACAPEDRGQWIGVVQTLVGLPPDLIAARQAIAQAAIDVQRYPI
jgi:alkylation response protein AidB-like acyl-CoA dehydrogenase